MTPEPISLFGIRPTAYFHHISGDDGYAVFVYCHVTFISFFLICFAILALQSECELLVIISPLFYMVYPYLPSSHCSLASWTETHYLEFHRHCNVYSHLYCGCRVSLHNPCRGYRFSLPFAYSGYGRSHLDHHLNGASQSSSYSLQTWQEIPFGNPCPCISGLGPF